MKCFLYNSFCAQGVVFTAIVNPKTGGPKYQLLKRSLCYWGPTEKFFFSVYKLKPTFYFLFYQSQYVEVLDPLGVEFCAG